MRRRPVRGRFPRLVLGFAGGLLLGAWAASAAAPVSFNRDIRPILSDHCYACHGPDEKTRKAGLRLDREAEARQVLKSGAAAVVPGEPSKSSLVARIECSDESERMPPAETKKPLTPAKIELLRRWIAEGAGYEGHWAYLAPRRPELPEVRDPAWGRNEIDRFVQARLDREGLQPSPEAPREKLLRRVTLDLTGLPPTVEELDAFLADGDAKAYDRVVDRLLASPHYGERMAQQWLDLARYGETQGYHHDRHRDQWHWRDWVIRAFNENLPYDRFTVDQLAGDLLPNPTREQWIATGFHRNEMTTSEGGALPEEYLVKYAVGRVDTTARVWLGTSMACGECHDHKYDPITTRDFYRFFAFFYDTPENGLDAEELNPSPRITLESAEDRARAARLDREVAALEAAEKLIFEAPKPDWDAAQAAWEKRHRDQSLGGWESPKLASARVLAGPGSELRQADDGSVRLHETPAPGGTVYELKYHTTSRDLRGLRLEALPDAAFPGRGAGLGRDGEFRLSRVEAEIRSLEPSREAYPGDAPVSGTWHSVGPFPAGSLREAFDKEFGPEKTVEADASYADGKLRWTPRAPANEGEPLALEGRHAATYFARTITVREGRILAATIAHRDGVRVWWNGVPLLVSAGPRDPKAEPERMRLWLRPGENRLLIKAARGEGAESPGVRFLLGPEPVTDAPLEWVSAAADKQTAEHPVRAILDDQPATAWSAGGTATEPRTAWIEARDRFGFQGGTELLVRLRFETAQPEARLGRFRVSVGAAPLLGEFNGLPDDVRAALAVEEGARSDTQRLALRRQYRLQFVPEAAEARQLLAARRKERDDFRNGWPTAMVMRPSTPARETQIRIRGQYANKGDTVTPGVPEALFPWSADLPPNRLGLARWLVDPGHPLTARVAVNQYWQRYFGNGLVKTAEEFGSQGEWPSHPELLDWLATEFVRSGWDVKAMQRRIVTSATYRQDSIVDRNLLERDPENRLLARGPRFRLDAENLRDVAMAASGLLNPKIGGPSVFPYQPPGLWGQVSFEGTRDYVQSEGAENYRRGLYTYWRRSIPYASFTVFDAPSREVCIARRPRTNTPLQALALLNDPVYVEAARAFAHRVLTRGGATVEARLDYAFRVALGRRPADRERAVLQAACEREFRRFAADRVAANRLVNVGASRPPVDVDIAELAAWTVVANTLLNLDETVTKG
jgi:hypothetical protein